MFMNRNHFLNETTAEVHGWLTQAGEAVDKLGAGEQSCFLSGLR